MRNSEGGFTPASSHATSSSRDCSGVISIWSRAINNPDVGRFDRTRHGTGNNADHIVRKDERYRKHHRAGTPSLTAAVLISPQEQPSRSSRPQSFMASA